MRNLIFCLGISATIASAFHPLGRHGASRGKESLGHDDGGASIQLDARPAEAQQSSQTPRTFLERRQNYAFDDDGLQDDDGLLDDNEVAGQAAGEGAAVEASYFQFEPFFNGLLAQGRNNLVANQMANKRAAAAQQQPRPPAMVEMSESAPTHDEVDEAEDELVGMGMIELLDDEDVDEEDDL